MEHNKNVDELKEIEVQDELQWQNQTDISDEALEALLQEEWLQAMGRLKSEYQNIPVPEQARTAVQVGIARAKEERQTKTDKRTLTSAKRSGAFYRNTAMLATAAATLFLFVLFNTNHQLAVTAADIPALKPIVELMTGQEYHDDVYLDVKVAHLSAKSGEELPNHADTPLSDLFVEGADYIGVISAEIHAQVQQLALDGNLAEQFTQIAPNQKYYYNAEGNLVIVLEEYETAPEFVISPEAIQSILR